MARNRGRNKTGSLSVRTSAPQTGLGARRAARGGPDRQVTLEPDGLSQMA